MGLVLKTAEIKNSVKQVRSNIESNRTGYSNALQVVQRFSENEELRSESWDTAKSNVLIAHQLIVQGMQTAQEVMLRDLSTIEGVLGEGDDKDEDVMIARIEELTKECIRYEEAIRNLQRIAGRSIITGYSGIWQAIENYKALLEKTKAELQLLKEDLEKFREKSASTASLLLSVDSLLQAVECAINDAEVYITGTGTLSDGSWKIIIPEMINDIKDEESLLALSDEGYQFLAALEIGTDWKNSSFIKIDESGNIVEIKNQDVGDGGITVGIGIYVNESYTERIQMLETLGIKWDDVNHWVPYNLILQAFNSISKDYINKVNNVIEKYNLSVTQEQYDALFAMAYNRMALFNEGGAVDKLLSTKNNNMDDWREALLKEYKTLKNWDIYGDQWTKRIEDELELYFKGDYVKDHE